MPQVADLRKPDIAMVAVGGVSTSTETTFATRLLPEAISTQTKTPDRIELPSESGAEFGAEHRVRTGDLRLGKATLYQLS